MVRRSVLVLLTAVLIVPAAFALTFEVDVDEEVNSSEFDLNYMEEVETLQTINVTFDNRGSIGCVFRLKAEFEQGNDTFTRYSQGYPLWAGSATTAELNYIPYNYTGQVDTTVYSHYCEREEEIDSFTFNVTENTLFNGTVDTRTVEVNDRQARIETGVENGTLVPEEAPTFWKASGAEITQGEAVISYDPPIFREGASMSYTVLDENSTVVGTAEVLLEEQPTTWEELGNNLEENSLELLAFLVLVNIFVLTVKPARRKIKALK